MTEAPADDFLGLFSARALIEHIDIRWCNKRSMTTLLFLATAGLADPKNPTFKRYFYLLENLASVKTFNICLDLECDQAIICNLYTLILSIVK